MEFESAKETAVRLGVNIRTVQKWAKENKFNGAKKLGREWLIPQNATPDNNSCDEKTTVHQLLPVLSNDFVPGYCNDMIAGLADETDKAIATAELYYYKGKTQQAIEIAELYLNHADYNTALSASFIYAFANLSSGKLNLTELGFENIKRFVMKALSKDDPDFRASAVFIGTATLVLLHQDTDELPPLQTVMNDLPAGLRVFASYIMAHKVYLEKDYSRAVGIAEGVLTFKGAPYPVPSLYLKLMRCVCLMNLKDSQRAKSAFNDINRIALEEEIFQPFAEHHGLLQGIIESQIKKTHPEAYREIVAMVKNFSTGWSTVHNELTKSSVTISLTTTEFAIAMLFNRNWSVKEISQHMDISPRMVKHHLSVIYEKLDVSNREELGRFLLK
ncbi:MAG: hypothetical protein IKK10_05910 [Clostridia bacterium]|nr:hypothetical protein [Clostridia bacterium]